MGSLRRMIAFVKPYRKQVILAGLLLFMASIIDLLIPRLTQRIIDQGIATHNVKLIVNMTVLMFAAAFINTLMTIGNAILSVQASMGMGADIRSTMVRKIQTFSFGNLEHIQSSQLLIRTTNDVEIVQGVVQIILRILVRMPFWMMGSIVMLIITSPRLTLIVLLLALAVLGVVLIAFTKVHPLFLVVQKKLERLNQIMQENLAGIRVVRAFNRTEHEKIRFDQANVDLTQTSIYIARLIAILMPTAGLLVNLGIAGVIWISGRPTTGFGGLTVGEIVASVDYMSRLLLPIMTLGSMLGTIAAADASAQRILEVLDSTAEVQNRPKTQVLSDIKGHVVFENVCFGYNGNSDELVLKDINLVAEPGQKIAILGMTGSGKSSLIHLIPRFYDVKKGQVMLDGVDVRDLPLDVLRSHVGVALQEAILFSGTIRENICYGRPNASDEEVIAAAKIAQAHNFINAFPEGYQTMVGQRGVNLSGGEKQRLAIARALLIQPKILILDDSISAVDLATETKIEGALRQAVTDCTTFIIAQRVSTVLNADKIVVLDKGQIVAEGKHAQLMNSSPIYQEIYESQLGNGIQELIQKGESYCGQTLAN